MNAPHTIPQRLLYWLCWSVMLITLSLTRRLRRHGAARIPRSGPCLLVCNHQSFLDPALVGFCMTGRQMHSLARHGLFNVPIFGRIIRRVNAIPLKQGSGDRAAIREALGRLADGAAVLVFPEGARTPDGQVHTFQRGVALLVSKASCPVVPIAISGAFEAWPRSRKLPRLWGGTISVAVGEPIEHHELLREGAPAALERLQHEVRSLLGELKGGAGLAVPPGDAPGTP